MRTDQNRAVSHDGDIVKIDGKPVRMEYLIRDSFWAGGHAIVLLDPTAYFDDPAYGGRKAPREVVKNLRAYAPSGELRWEAQQPHAADHYYLIESREPLVALSFSAFRCDIDLATGKILSKESLK